MPHETPRQATAAVLHGSHLALESRSKKQPQMCSTSAQPAARQGRSQSASWPHAEPSFKQAAEQDTSCPSTPSSSSTAAALPLHSQPPWLRGRHTPKDTSNQLHTASIPSRHHLAAVVPGTSARGSQTNLGQRSSSSAGSSMDTASPRSVLPRCGTWPCCLCHDTALFAHSIPGRHLPAAIYLLVSAVKTDHACTSHLLNSGSQNGCAGTSAALGP